MPCQFPVQSADRVQFVNKLAWFRRHTTTLKLAATDLQWNYVSHDTCITQRHPKFVVNFHINVKLKVHQLCTDILRRTMVTRPARLRQYCGNVNSAYKGPAWPWDFKFSLLSYVQCLQCVCGRSWTRCLRSSTQTWADVYYSLSTVRSRSFRLV